MNIDFEKIATGRSESFFTRDLANKHDLILSKLQKKRIVIVGAAGSIGAAVVKTLLKFQPRELTLVDLSENNLVELTRDIRSSRDIDAPKNLSILPIGMGSLEFKRFFREHEKFDYFFNLSAMKHVRSEKDVYSLIRMIDTNMLFLHEFLREHEGEFEKVFSVSSDKAANPANLMGATKMGMEEVLLCHSNKQPFSTARFANVAFSDGSLPYGFLRRIEKRQPLAAPNDVKRYFISHQEAGELCVLSAALGENRDVFFPKLDSGKDEKSFSWIAERLLENLGYEPVLCDSEEGAKERFEELVKQKRWPCFFFESDTTGEKAYEEFFVNQEKVDNERFEAVGVVKRDEKDNKRSVDSFFAFYEKAKNDSSVSKGDYVNALIKLVPTLSHEEKGKNLDQKM